MNEQRKLKLELAMTEAEDIEFEYRKALINKAIDEIIHEIVKEQDKVLSYEEWYALNKDEIDIELAESGADREMDFDVEFEFLIRYDKYQDER